MFYALGGGSRAVSRVHRHALIFFLAILALCGASHRLEAALLPGASAPVAFRPDRIIVRLAPDADPAAVAALHARLHAIVRHQFSHGGSTHIVVLPAGLSVAAALAAYRQSTLIASAEPDYLLQAFAAPNDFRYHNNDQWNLHNPGIYGGVAGADIQAESAWDLQHDAADIIVAVVDSGVRYTHEDLAANMWVNPGETGLDASGRDRRTNGVDDDGDGYIDDVHGVNVLNGSGDPNDDWGHGTHVAGIVGGVGNNGVGITGVAWRVKIMACKFIDANGAYSVSDAITCLDYARVHGARIVTASWGGYAFDSPALRNAIGALRNAGIIVAAAAGNDNNNNDATPLYPASYDFDNIVAVAATDRTDTRAGYSNYGAVTVDLGAPGSPVFSAWAGSDHDYRYNEGTSMAAPHIAGACALLWTRFPTDTYRQIIQRILSTVDPLPSLSGRTKTGGRLNLAAALASGTAPPPPPPPAPLPAPGGLNAGATSESSATLSWTDNATTESGYQIERSTDNTAFTVVATTGANATTASVTGLRPSTTYYFRVRAFAEGTASAYSNIASATTAGAPPPPPPPPAGSWSHADVGSVAAAGTASGSGTSFAVAGSGADIWDRGDEFHFMYQSVAGDGTWIAQVTGMTDTDGWAKAGLMLRESLAPGSRHIFLAINPSSAPSLFWRTASDGISNFRSAGYSVTRVWLKLVRTGNAFQAYHSADGASWSALGGSVVIDLPATLLAGLAVTSHRDGVLCTANFEQVAFGGGSAPPPAPPPVTVNAPGGLGATSSGVTQIALAWTDNATNETGFQIERSIDNATFAVVASLAANVSSHTDTTLAAGTTYYYRVRAVAGSSQSAYSNTASATTAPAAPPPSGAWSHADIGAVGLAGSDDAAGTTITVRGSGNDVWDRADAFRFLYRTMSGDCTIEAQVMSITNTDPWAKAGVMIRESLAPDARNAFVFLTPNNFAHTQLRAAAGGVTASTAGPWGLAIPYWVRLTRTGGTIVASVSPNGSTWTTLATHSVSMSAEILVGFAVTAHNNTQLNTATFGDPFIQ